MMLGFDMEIQSNAGLHDLVVMKTKTNIIVALLICASLMAAVASAVEYGPDAKMILPKDYRQWVFLSSGLGMSYTQSATPNPNPGFDNVFVNPEAYQAFMKTGTWPDKTVLILEARASDSKVSINKDGRVQTNIVGIEAHVKDSSHGGWAFYSFGNGAEQEGTLLPRTATCYSCHEQNAAVDTTFVQFYPTLIEVAKSKGTFKDTERSTASPPAAPSKRYSLDGTVISMDVKRRTLVVQHGDIPGFMAAMTMPYSAGKTEDLAKVASGDQIHADVVVNADEMHLENISVTGHPNSKNTQ
jgi:Cu/Ag efflux protein CusF